MVSSGCLHQFAAACAVTLWEGGFRWLGVANLHVAHREHVLLHILWATAFGHCGDGAFRLASKGSGAVSLRCSATLGDYESASPDKVAARGMGP